MKKHLTLALALLTLSGTSTHAQLPSYLPTDGLVAWYPFNGNANDESGNGNDGVVNGATLAVDRFSNAGSAYRFDGVGNFIEVPNSSSLQNISSITISAWININQLYSSGGSGFFPILSKSNNQGIYGIYAFGFWSPNIIAHLNGEETASPFPFDFGNWQHVVVVISDNLTSFYLGGVLLWEGPSGVFPNSPLNNMPLLIGSDRPGLVEFANGLLDDIAIYNRALTPQEIQNLYTNTTADTGNGAAPLPQGIPYQAAARDANGQPVVDSPVNVRFSLHEGAADGATSYIESHSLTTNSIGLFNTVFGNGTPEQSAFDSINWAATTKFLQVEIDLGSGYVDMGTTQLLSVPYAFRSAQAATLKNAALPNYPDNAAALAGGLVAGEMYRTATGDLKVVY